MNRPSNEQNKNWRKNPNQHINAKKGWPNFQRPREKGGYITVFTASKRGDERGPGGRIYHK